MPKVPKIMVSLRSNNFKKIEYLNPRNFVRQRRISILGTLGIYLALFHVVLLYLLLPPNFESSTLYCRIK